MIVARETLISPVSSFFEDLCTKYESKSQLKDKYSNTNNALYIQNKTK